MKKPICSIFFLLASPFSESSVPKSFEVWQSTGLQIQGIHYLSPQQARGNHVGTGKAGIMKKLACLHFCVGDW